LAPSDDDGAVQAGELLGEVVAVLIA